MQQVPVHTSRSCNPPTFLVPVHLPRSGLAPTRCTCSALSMVSVKPGRLKPPPPPPLSLLYLALYRMKTLPSDSLYSSLLAWPKRKRVAVVLKSVSCQRL